MSFYGPWTGEYLNDLARRMVDRLTDFPGKPIGPKSPQSELGYRFALGILLSFSVVAGWRRGWGLWALAGRVGLVTVAIVAAALVAFEVAPDLVAWANFGLPDWARLVGVPLGAYALVLGFRGKLARAALPFALACALLSASWVVVLMIARGAAKWRLSDCPKGARSAS